MFNARGSLPTSNSDGSLSAPILEASASTRRSTVSKNAGQSVKHSARDAADIIIHESNEDDLEARYSNAGMLTRQLSSKKKFVPPPPSIPPPLPSTPPRWDSSSIKGNNDSSSEVDLPAFNLTLTLKSFFEGASLTGKSSTDIEGVLTSVNFMEESFKKARERANKAEMELKLLRESVQKGKRMSAKMVTPL